MKEISNRQLTLLRKLNRKKYRQKEQLFLIEGDRAVEQIIDNGRVELKELYFDDSQHYWQHQKWKDLGGNYSAAILNSEHFREVSDTDNPQGVLALCKIPREADLSTLTEQAGTLLATDRIQDPGNLGTIIRTAVWFGAKGILSGKGTVDLFHPKVVRSTAGATGSLNYKNEELRDILPKFENEGWQVLILDGGSGAEDIRETNLKSRTILVVGNEANGVDEDLFTGERRRVTIPSRADDPDVESLNAAMAVGIALYALS